MLLRNLWLKIYALKYLVATNMNSGNMELKKLVLFSLSEQLESAVCIILKMNA